MELVISEVVSLLITAYGAIKKANDERHKEVNLGYLDMMQHKHSPASVSFNKVGKSVSFIEGIEFHSIIFLSYIERLYHSY